jgi:hypothetical protein
MQKWKYIGTCTELQPFEIAGLNVWKFDWTRRGDRAYVNDPLYNQEFCFSVYEIRSGDHLVTFAAGEFSNGVWGFFLREQDQ